MMLRPYQVDALAAVRQAYADGARRVLLVSPTGSGKTRMGSAVLAGGQAKGLRYLWVTHRRELVSQASDALTRAGVKHGVILAGYPRDTAAPMQVCSIQTLTADGEAPENIDGIVLDEAHHATAGTWRALVAAYPNLRILLGLTATPERGDGSPLGDVFVRLVQACSVRTLQALGHLVPCHVIAPSKRVKTLAADPLDAYRTHLLGKRALVFAACVNEAHALAKRFCDSGVLAAAIDGDMKHGERERALEQFALGNLHVITNVFCLTEGTDVPSIEGVIIARGCSTWSAWAQMIGRGLRPSQGKTACTVLDLMGHVHAHGMPDDERPFDLAVSETEREKASKPAALASCRGCGAVYAYGPSVCPRCGVAAPPPPKPKVKREDMAAVQGVASFDDRVRYLARLVVIGAERGYSAKWPGVLFKQRFGHWPAGALLRAAKKGTAA